jgi:hypothetical protein
MTTGVDQPSLPPVQPALAKPNPFQRLAGVFFSPGETLRSIADRPDITVPLIVTIVISFACTMLIMPHIDFAADIRASMEARGNVTGAQAEQAMRIGMAVGKALLYATPFLIPLFWALYAGVVLLLFRLFGAEGTYQRAYSIKVYVSLPLIIRGILAAIIVMSRGKISVSELATVVRSNLGFLANMKANPVLFTLLSNADIFVLWSLVLSVIGYAYMAKVSRGRSAAVIVTIWIVFVLIGVGFAALGSLGAKARA